MLPLSSKRNRLFKSSFLVLATLGCLPPVEAVSAVRAAARQVERQALEKAQTQRQALRPWDQARQMAAEAVTKLTEDEKYSLLRGANFSLVTGSPDTGYYVGNIPAIPRLGIPPLKMQDAGAGFRTTEAGTNGTTTEWPSLLALAATWDEQLVGEVAAAISAEFSGKGANIVLGPSINVHRSALGGRNFEYMSGEDPYLGSRMTRAYVKAMQEGGVMACAKHFAFNEQETNRMTENSVVDQRVAWELYYPPFEAAVEAGVGSFMCAYNKVNGTWSCENSDILKQDLRGRMGFQGLVMSDWFATHNSSDLLHGLDEELPGVNGLGLYNFKDDALNAIDYANPGVINGAVEDVLSAIYHLGLDQVNGCVPGADPPNCDVALDLNQSTAEHKDLAGRAAAASLVLLKNEGGFLPLDPAKIKKLVLFADPIAAQYPIYAEYYQSGLGSGHVSAGQPVASPLAYVYERAKQLGIIVSIGNGTCVASATESVQDADAIVVFASTTSTEGQDRITLALDGSAVGIVPGPSIVDQIIPAVGVMKPTAVLLSVPGAVLTPWRDEAKAIAALLLGGERSAQTWEGLLFGDLLPEGRLPVMFPATDKDYIPIEQSLDVPYCEGLLTSYRSKTFHSAFPFGFGLSYTSFSLSDPVSADLKECSASGAASPLVACLKLTVTNTGSRPGKEVVQAYAHFPEQHVGDTDLSKQSPDIVLKGFSKTRSLKPGESTELTFGLTERDISMWDVLKVGWKRMKTVEVHFGFSSEDIQKVITITP